MNKLFFLVAFLLFAQAGFAWWNIDWSYRQAVTINGSVSALTNHQVNLKLNVSSVGANWNWSNNGSDIRITNNSDNQQDFWIEHWNASGSKNISIWVNTSSLAVGSNTFYVYYGNTAAASASNASNTFAKTFGANDLRGEWQMDEGSGTQANDTSGNGKHGILAGASMNWSLNNGGFIANNSNNKFAVDNSVLVAGTGSVDVGNMSSSISSSSNWTLLLWFNASSGNQYVNLLNTYPGKGFKIEFDHLGVRKLYGYLTGIGGGSSGYIDLWNTTAVPTNTWIHIAVRRNGTLYTSFVNGTRVGDVTWTANPGFDNVFFGGNASNQYQGGLDSFQFYNRSLSNNEISAYYFRRKYTSPEPVVLSVGAEEIGLVSATIQLPLNTTYNKLNGSVTLNFTTNPAPIVSQCKYELDGVNTSLPTCANTTLTLTDGSHSIKVWVNDTANNWNSTPLVYFVSDFTEPNINIQSPTNSTYTISTVALNFTIGESVGLSTCKYELDGVNTTISCTNTTISGLSGGGHSIKIWANDTAGNMNNSATISFSNDIVLYVYVYDETTPTQNITFNLTLSNSTASKTATNQNYYTGNFTADPRGSLTLTLSAAGYNSRTFYTTWDGTTKVNYTAYLLTGTNQYTFYVKNANSVAIEGAVVTIKRSINNVLQTVGEATTDTAGTVLFTLTPNIVYTVQVVASNYNTHTGTILPTQASYTYTITLSSSTSTPNFQQVWNGIRYSYQPAFTILKNTINTFNFTIYSIVDGLTSYGMNISINGTIVSSQTGNTSTGGSITATVDLRNYTTEAGYARLWFTKTGMPTQVIQPDKNFNVHTNPTSNISAAAIAINFGNTTGITEQTKVMISVITAIIMMAVTAGFGAGRNGSAIIGLLVFGAFVWVGWVPALYLTFGILFVFAILMIKGAY